MPLRGLFRPRSQSYVVEDPEVCSVIQQQSLHTPLALSIDVVVAAEAAAGNHAAHSQFRRRRSVKCCEGLSIGGDISCHILAGWESVTLSGTAVLLFSRSSWLLGDRIDFMVYR